MSPERLVSDVGEFALIERISRIVGRSNAIAGIGDDAAVLDTDGPEYQLATVDMLVESVHFDMDSTDAFDLGRRAIAINLSDIAACGGLPTVALTSLALSPTMPLGFVESMYSGMKQEASRFHAAIVGGNIAKTSGPLCIDVALLGRVPKPELVLRSGARVGDVLVVTGVLGAAAAARLEGRRAQMLTMVESTSSLARVSVPEPRIEAGRLLASLHFAHAMLDVSDGLAADLRHLTGSSGVGAVVREESLPVSISARRVAPSLGCAPVDLALFGGEDYELLAAIPESSVEAARHALGATPLYEVGTVLAPDQGVLLEQTGGKRIPLPEGGWKHF
jgi:thiamine-monophosphate kinase